MTVNSSSNVKTYTGNAVAVAFSTTFQFIVAGDIKVYVDGVLKTITTDYTVTGGGGATGTVTFNSAPSLGAAIILQRLVDYIQDTDFANFDGNPADVTEAQFDLVVMQTQQLEEATNRSLQVPLGSEGISLVLPTPDAGKALVWNEAENALENSSENIVTLLDDVTAQAAIATSAANAASSAAVTASAAALAAAASASLANSQTLVPSFSFAGLIITIGTFSIIDASGVSVSVSGSSITAKVSSTQYLVVDLASKAFKLLDRTHHDGCMVIAKVVSGSSSITTFDRLYSAELPTTALGRTHKRMATALTSGQITVAVIGDSLLTPSGSGTKWDALLFDTAQVAVGYNVTNAVNFTVTNYAVGGTTSEYGMCVVGEGSYPGTGAYNNTALAYARAEGTRRFSPPKIEVGRSPLLTNPPDLVILGFGANGGTYDYSLTEFIVKACREAGSEVIIVTQNNRTDNATFLLSKGDIIKKIALEYGCAVADTWEYVLEKDRAGFTTHADVIHMAADGHKAWAEAIKGVLSPAFIMKSSATPTLPAQCIGVSYEANNLEWNRLANSCQIQFTPSSTTGTAATSTAATSSVKNPAILYGGKTSANAATSLASGEVASYAHPYANYVSLLIDTSSVFTADIKTDNQTVTLGSVTFGSTTTNGVIVLEAVNGGSYANVSTAFRSNKGIQVVCTSGTAIILGVVFHCDKMREVDIETEVKYTGTWSTEAWSYSHPISRVSDTDQDSFVFDFEGSEALMYFSSKSAAGKLDIYCNGYPILTAQDCYNSGSFLKTIRVPSGGNTTDYPNRRRGKNTVQVKLNGANASAGASGAANRKLGLLAIHVFDRG
jgi:hypothetical protein